MQTDYIVNDPLKVGATDFIYGDKIDADDLVRRGVWNERLRDSLKSNRRIVPLTRETFVNAVRRRAAGQPWPPRGFTEAFLVEGGYIDAADIPTATAKAPRGAVTQGALGEDRIPVGAYFVQPKKNGKFTLFDVMDAEGKLLRAKSFKKREDAEAFLTAMSTDASTADTSAEPTAETENGGDLRSSPDDGQG